MVLALGTRRITGPLGYTHSVLGFGLSAIAGFRGRHTVRIFAGNGSIARVCVDRGLAPIRALRHPHSILALGLAAIAGLTSRYSV